ncbi:LamG domain-containing protein [Chitinophaga sp. ARDCPP14]|uniref:LamG domain-containing protein n=1 Tax=Chitinophaga sp. ARDCPP14 TaxID=3391139 RepID=UPI003F51FDCC
MLTTKTFGKLSIIATVTATLFSCEKAQPVKIDKLPAGGLTVTPNLTLLAAAPVSTDSLIAYWPLDSCLLANDVTGNGHNGTSFSTTFTTDRFGSSKGAYYFNGTSSYISVDDKTDIKLLNTNYTFSAWVKLDNYESSWGSSIIAKRNGSSNGYAWSITGLLTTPGLVSLGTGGGSFNAYGTKVVTTGSWHMVSTTYNYATQQLSIYVDGILDNITNAAPPISSTTNKLYIGRDEISLPTGYFIKGALDDIRIYRRSLTAAEILALYNQTTAPTSGLIAYWPLNSCSAANDLTGLGHNGTAYNITYTKDRSGINNSASYFNGTSSYISVEDKADIRLTATNFSMNAWVKLDSYNSSWGSEILVKRNTSSPGFTWSITGLLASPIGTGSFGPGGGFVNAFGTQVVALNSWHMVSNVYNVSTQQLSIYIDGVLDNVTTGVLPANAPASKLYIGSDDLTLGTNGYYLKGAMEDIRIYNRALSATEIQQLFTAVN